jgi:hypothetical protein
MSQTIGVSETLRTTTANSSLLTKGETPGKHWVYVQANGAIAQYDVVAVDETGQAATITKALADASTKVGVASAAFADNEYGWAQIYGNCTLNVLASCAADAILYTSATAGSLDDTSTSQTKIDGILLTTSRGGTDGSAAGFMFVEPFADR